MSDPEYQKRYRSLNKERLRANDRAKYLRNRDRILNDPARKERSRINARNYYYATRDDILLRKRNRPASVIDGLNAKRRSPEGRLRRIEHQNRRRARLAGGCGSATTDEIKSVLSAERCYLCGGKFTIKRPATLDHVIPLSKGGRHEVTNLAAAHASCNSKKHARLEDATGQIRLL